LKTLRKTKKQREHKSGEEKKKKKDRLLPGCVRIREGPRSETEGEDGSREGGKFLYSEEENFVLKNRDNVIDRTKQRGRGEKKSAGKG